MHIVHHAHAHIVHLYVYVIDHHEVHVTPSTSVSAKFEVRWEITDLDFTVLVVGIDTVDYDFEIGGLIRLFRDRFRANGRGSPSRRWGAWLTSCLGAGRGLRQ